MLVKIIIDDLNLYQSTDMMVQLIDKQDERSFVEGVAAGLQAWLRRQVNVDHVEGVWYLTIEEDL